jgi:hypothetical protein
MFPVVVCLDFHPKCFASPSLGSAVWGVSHRLKAAETAPVLTNRYVPGGTS